MKLHKLLVYATDHRAWVSGTTSRRDATIEICRATEANDMQVPGNYCFIVRGADKRLIEVLGSGTFRAMDPIMAQAVLYHLLEKYP